MLLIALLLSLGLPALSFAQISAAQALSVRQMQDPRPSPDGSRVAFTVSEPPRNGGSARNIWLYETRTGAVVQLTRTGKDSSPRWSPDGKSLAFLSSRTGEAQIFLSSLSGGDPVQLTNNSGAISSFEWSPGGQQIAFLAYEPKTEDQTRKELDKDDAQVITVVGGSDVPARVWVLDVETKKERRLSSAPYDVSAMSWQPDGKALIVTATDRPDPERWTNRIFNVSIGSGAFTEIIAPQGPFSQVKSSPDGSMQAYVGASAGGPIEHDLYVVSSKGGTPTNLTGASVDRPVGQFVWKDNQILDVLFEIGFSNKLYTVAIGGKSAPTTGLDVAPSTVAPMPGGGFAFTHETAAELPELWISDKQGAARKVTKINESWSSIPLVKPEFIRYKSFDGTEIEAALLKPPTTGGAKFPTVFLFHGGPIGRWSYRFDAEGQMLVSRGYAVLYPNIRGATGYGHHMIDLIRSEPLGGSGWGTGPFKDALAGVDALIQRGVADPDRLGIGGWSYGGYMASWAVSHTNRFKAAVSGAGVYDMFNDLGTEIASYVPGDEWNYGPFFDDQNREALHKDSPATYVKNVRTPILLLHGELDPVDTVGQTYAFYRALKHYGATTQLVVYPREGHSLREEKHQIDRLNRTVDWYDQFLKHP
jgi:dipeptidyl aminopeptidase/acylaminoacyl peptidase